VAGRERLQAVELREEPRAHPSDLRVLRLGGPLALVVPGAEPADDLVAGTVGAVERARKVPHAPELEAGLGGFRGPAHVARLGPGYHGVGRRLDGLGGELGAAGREEREERKRRGKAATGAGSSYDHGIDHAGETARPSGRARRVGPGGFEPPLPVPKTGVLPLDDGPAT